MTRENRIRLHRLQRQLGRQGNSTSGRLGYGNPFGAGSSLPPFLHDVPSEFPLLAPRSLFKADCGISLFHSSRRDNEKNCVWLYATRAGREKRVSRSNISSALLLPLTPCVDVIKAMIYPRKYFKWPLARPSFQ